MVLSETILKNNQNNVPISSLWLTTIVVQGSLIAVYFSIKLYPAFIDFIGDDFAALFSGIGVLS